MTNRRRLLRVLLVAVPVLFIVYTLGGFFGVPLLITKVILPRVSETLNGDVRVAKAACNPFVLSLTLEGLEVVDAAGVRVVGCDRVYANAQVSSIWRGGPHFRRLTLTRPFVAAELDKAGQINLAGLVKPSAEEVPEEEPGKPWRVSAERLEVADGRVEFTDLTPAEPFAVVATPVDAVFEHFDTDPDHSNVHRFTAALESGGTLSWEGDFFLDPLSSQGRVELAGLALEQFRPYLADLTTAELTRGVTGVTLGYRFAPLKTPQVAEVTLERYTLANLTLSLAGVPLLDLREAVLEGVRADAVDRRLAADTLRITGARLRVERAEDGTLSVVSAVDAARPPLPRATAATDAPATPAPAPPPAPGEPGQSPIARVIEASLDLVLQALNPWAVRVEKVVLEDAALQWSDRAAPAPVDITIDAIRLEAGPIRSEEGYRVPLRIVCTVAGSGAVEVGGQVRLEARDAELDVAVRSLPLPPVGPYLRAAMPEVTLASGAVTARGKATASAAQPDQPQLTFAGDFGVATLRLDAPSAGEAPLLAWDDLNLTGIRFDHAAATAHADRVAVAGLAGAATRAAAPEPAPESEPQPASADRPPPPYAITVGELHATSHDLVLIDEAVQPAGRITLSGLDATLRGLATAGDTAATLELRGTLQGAASLNARGTITPDPARPAADLTIGLAALPLTDFSGYTGEYIGFPVKSGELGTDLTVRLAEHQLDAQLGLVLDRFHLGDRLDDTDAPNLPVKLALGLLRDRSDRIDLDIPIEGDLNDPSVRVGHLVVQAITNTLVKIAASPFDFIAGAIGGGEGGEQQLDRIAFAPGADSLDDEPRRKLDLLARALRDRPALTLVIRGGATAAIDEPALRKAMLMARIRRDLAATLPSDDPRRADPSGVEVPDEQYRYAVNRLAGQVALGEPPALDEETPLTIPEPEPRRVRRGGRSSWRIAPTRPAATATGEVAADATAEPGETPAVPFADTEAAVLAALPLPADALTQLAGRRADAVRQFLEQAGQVESQRLQAAPPAEPADEPAVRLELQ